MTFLRKHDRRRIQTAINSPENRGWIFACPPPSSTFSCDLSLPSSSTFIFSPLLFQPSSLCNPWILHGVSRVKSYRVPSYYLLLLSGGVLWCRSRIKSVRIKERRKMRMKQWPPHQLEEKDWREQHPSLREPDTREDDPWSLMTLQTFRTLDSPPLFTFHVYFHPQLVCVSSNENKLCLERAIIKRGKHGKQRIDMTAAPGTKFILMNVRKGLFIFITWVTRELIRSLISDFSPFPHLTHKQFFSRTLSCSIPFYLQLLEGKRTGHLLWD